MEHGSGATIKRVRFGSQVLFVGFVERVIQTLPGVEGVLWKE